MNLLIFKLRLLFHLGLFLLELSANFSKKSKPAAISIFIILLLIGVVFLFSFVKKMKPIESKISPAPSPLHPEYFSSKDYSEENLVDQLDFWKKIEESQPKSRDVLINISKLNQALGRAQEAEKYWGMARELDPNFAAFK